MSRLVALLALTLCATLSHGAAYPDPDYPPALEELSFTVEGQRLPGLVYLANGAGPHPTVVLLHGLPGNEKNLDIAQSLRSDGYNVMFFHYRGAWGAEGDYALTHLKDDVLGALGHLRDNAQRYRIDTGAMTLIGHSMGGYAALASASSDSDLACVAALAPANLAVIAAGITADDPAALGFLTYADSLYMLRGFDGAAMAAQLKNTAPDILNPASFGPGLRGKSVLLIAGKEDSVTPAALMVSPIANAYAQQEGLRSQYHEITGDHSFSWSRDTLTSLIQDWLASDCRNH